MIVNKNGFFETLSPQLILLVLSFPCMKNGNEKFKVLNLGMVEKWGPGPESGTPRTLWSSEPLRLLELFRILGFTGTQWNRTGQYFCYFHWKNIIAKNYRNLLVIIWRWYKLSYSEICGHNFSKTPASWLKIFFHVYSSLLDYEAGCIVAPFNLLNQKLSF